MKKTPQTFPEALNSALAEELLDHLQNHNLNKWYPLAMDKEYGGYFSNLSYDWRVMPSQEKMIVTQARHIWTASKAAIFFNNDFFNEAAAHGYKFLKEKMWDEKYGGFYQIRSREGELSDYNRYMEEKRTYGNAFGIYALAALYELTGDEEVLRFAVEAFKWLEKHAADSADNGYFQFLTREGISFDKNSTYKTKACDAAEAGYKDQNSSIHLLEAYSELYKVWKSPELKERLKNILFLIRDKMVSSEGYLYLFFDKKWNPVSFRNEPEEIRKKNYGLDHVSFGHDYETAFLMLEASHILGLENDTATLSAAKKMIDHAIDNGWDKINGGFFDGGYYFNENEECRIIKDSKVWWAQAEGLNALLLFSKIFPEEKRYYELFLNQWDYIKEYLIDKELGDWYWASVEKEPFYRFEPKANIWKCNYHTGRALMNCILMLYGDNYRHSVKNTRLENSKKHFDEFTSHCRQLGMQSKNNP